MRKSLGIAIGIAAIAVAQPSFAQDAAESAVILSGTGERTGAAARSLGANSAGAIDRATNALRETRSGGANRSRRGRGAAASQSPAAAVSTSHRVYYSGDPLEFMDVPTYRLSNGQSLRLSGSFIAIPPTECVKNCR